MKPSNGAARGLDQGLIISDFEALMLSPVSYCMHANVVKVRRHYIRWAAQRQIIHEASHQLRLQAQQIWMDGDTEQERAHYYYYYY